MSYVDVEYGSGGSGMASYDLSNPDEIQRTSGTMFNFTTEKKARYIIGLFIMANTFTSIALYDGEQNQTRTGYFNNGSYTDSGITTSSGITWNSDTSYTFKSGASTSGPVALFIYHEK